MNDIESWVSYAYMHTMNDLYIFKRKQSYLIRSLGSHCQLSLLQPSRWTPPPSSQSSKNNDITSLPGTSYVGQYGMLGYTWVIFEKFSVLFPRDGYLFSTKFLYFSCKVGIYFEENFCICRTRWNPFTRNFLYFIPQSCCILHIKFLYISTR